MPSPTGERSMASRRRNGAAAWACGSANFIPRMRIADTRNESALIRNTASRPSSAATTPPTDAPTSRFTDHVAEERVLATSTSSRAVIFGSLKERSHQCLEQQQGVDQPHGGAGAHQQHGKDDDHPR